MQVQSIFTRFLSALGVSHTEDYSDSRFRNMTFKSLFGLSHLMTEYGIKNYAVRISDKSELTRLDTPFLAQTRNGVFVIVNEIDTDKSIVTYDSRGETEKAGLEDFKHAWNGIAFLAFPDKNSKEPDYGQHHLTEIVEKLSKYALGIAALIVFAYFFITKGVYSHISTILLAVFDCVGLYLSYMLVQKSLNIHSKTSDHVCGVLEKEGCDTIVSLKVSKLFNVFSWSEIGFVYFGVSLVTLLVFPHLWPSLALCNVCCLPYTVWSIWYQKFRAHHWCTLCVGVQSTLWILFFCYLFGGWLKESFPLHLDFFVLVAVYIFCVIFLNMILRFFKNLPCYEKNSRT